MKATRSAATGGPATGGAATGRAGTGPVATAAAATEPADARSSTTTAPVAAPVPFGPLRIAFAVAGIAGLALATAFLMQASWTALLWPWPGSRLSNVFVASILAAASVRVLWIAWSGELAAVRALLAMGMLAGDLRRRSVYAAGIPMRRPAA